MKGFLSEVSYLEAELCFEDTVQQFAVLATIAIVDALVGAHDGSSARFQTVHEREDIELVDRAIVSVGAESLAIDTRVASVLLKV
jgi:hypothetical protein